MSGPIKASSVRRPTAEEKSVFRALEKIHAAKSPILVIGAGGNRKLTSKMLSGVHREDGYSVHHDPAG